MCVSVLIFLVIQVKRFLPFIILKHHCILFSEYFAATGDIYALVVDYGFIH